MTAHWVAVDLNFSVRHAYHGQAGGDAATAVLLAIVNGERLAAELGATRLCWCLDSKPYHRSKLYPEYKRTPKRVSMEMETGASELISLTDRLPRFLWDLGYRAVFRERGFEADDLLAALCHTAGRNARVTVSSRDHDLLQVVSPRASLYDPVAKSTTTRESFRRDYGIHPTEFADCKAIAGCGSDNIPGVDGVAMPTAIKFLRGDPIGPKRYADIKAFLKTPEYERNLRLVTLPYDDCPPVEPESDAPRSPGAWRDLCESLERPGLASAVEGRGWRVGCAH